jgi:hypothetical protein
VKQNKPLLFLTELFRAFWYRNGNWLTQEGMLLTFTCLIFFFLLTRLGFELRAELLGSSRGEQQPDRPSEWRCVTDSPTYRLLGCDKLPRWAHRNAWEGGKPLPWPYESFHSAVSQLCTL